MSRVRDRVVYDEVSPGGLRRSSAGDTPSLKNLIMPDCSRAESIMMRQL